jgi:hypothetical protein
MRETVRQFALDEATAIEHSAPGFCEETRKDVGYVERIETMWADMLMKRWAHVEQLCLRYNVIL